jgi:hypothetical protein
MLHLIFDPDSLPEIREGLSNAPPDLPSRLAMIRALTSKLESI